jgi:hypothetical protein
MQQSIVCLNNLYLKFKYIDMNRLIIVGNGFDLAHGLPTGYCDFIDWYWRNVLSDIDLFSEQHEFGGNYDDNITEIKLQFRPESYRYKVVKDEFERITSFSDLSQFINKYSFSSSGANTLRNYPDAIVDKCDIKFKNNLFQTINQIRGDQNWVDIENQYYKLLKDCLSEENNSKVKKLNEEFDAIKKLLEKYLRRNVANNYNFDIVYEMQNTLNIFNLQERVRNEESYLNEFSDVDQQKLREWLLNYKTYGVRKLKEIDQYPKNLFINFNYTPTVDNYNSIICSNHRDEYGTGEVIQIHGKLNDASNPINFGFGDEMDDDYKAIEKKDDNEYLRNIKSFQYFQNSNYKQMLSFMESNKFQVYVMGHSCGLSDRILLNKIFEHTNCRSIKVFYYKNGESDNYTEIVQNISRHFNKKEMMRERIVNKTLCEPLPQIKLPLK